MEDLYNENTEESVIENTVENTDENPDTVHMDNSPYSPLYVPEQNKKNNRITIVLVGILLFCLIIGMILAVGKLVQEAEKEVAANLPAWKEGFQSFQEELKEELKKEVQEPYSKKPEADVYIPQEEYGYEEEEIPYIPEEEYDYGVDEEPYVPQAEDEYYVELADAIRDDLSYKVSKKDYSYTDEAGGVLVYVEYPLVSGTGFDDKFNEILENSAMYYAKELGAGNAFDSIVIVMAYITYMDENTLSVVLDETYSDGSNWYSQSDLYCLNFDIKTGSCRYNTEIIEPSNALVQAFRDMSEYQNGTVENLDMMSDEEILSYFSDEDSLILFYTPVGLEIGFNYEDGWITATLKDYEQYLNRL